MEEKPKRKRGHQPGKPLTEKHKLQIQATEIFQRVVKAAKGEVEMNSNQVRAAELVLSKTMPNLASVEQTILNNDDAKSMEQIKEELKTLIQSNPDLVKELLYKDTTNPETLNHPRH